MYTVTSRAQKESTRKAGGKEISVLGIARTEGVSALFPGYVPAMIATVAQNAVFFFAKRRLKASRALGRLLYGRGRDYSTSSPLFELVTAWQAAIVTVLVTNPLWEVNCEH